MGSLCCQVFIIHTFVYLQEEVDALEEQARSEKIHDQATARANANEVADIVMEAQQSSGN